MLKYIAPCGLPASAELLRRHDRPFGVVDVEHVEDASGETGFGAELGKVRSCLPFLSLLQPEGWRREDQFIGSVGDVP